MRSNDSKKRREIPSLHIIGRVTVLVLLLSSCPGAMAQTAPQFPTVNQPVVPAGPTDSKVEAYPLTAATRDVLTAWQKMAAGRTDMRVAIDERTSQALVFAPPSVQAQIQQELAAKSAPVAGPNVGLPVNAGPVLHQLQQLPAGEVHARLEGML